MTAKSGTARKCEYVSDEGKQCGAWATKDSDPPLCFLHSKTPEERQAQAARAARASNVRRRGNVEALPQADLRPDITLAEVLEVLRPILGATNELGAPDYSARLAACAVLVLAFPRYLRDTPEHVRELLGRVLPDDVPLDAEQLSARRAFRAIRKEYWSIPVHHPVRGLIARDLPRQFVLPWEDYATVVRLEKPADIPLDQADTFTLPDGRVALRRPGQLPLALEEAEDDGGLVRAVVNLT